MARKKKNKKEITKRENRWLFSAFALTFFICLAVLFTWPLVPNITKGIIGQSNFTDGPFFLWNLWWVKKAILAWQNPFFSQFVYYPANTNLTLHTLTFTTGLVFLPLSLFFSELVSLNLIQLSSIVLSALGMVWLVDYIAKPISFVEKTGGIIAGIIFGFSPFMFSHLLAGHYNLTMLWLIPLVVLFEYKTIREDNWRSPILLALFAILLGYLDLQLLIFTAIICLMILIVEMALGPRYFFKKPRILRLLAALVIFAAIFLLPYWLMMKPAWQIKTNFLTYNSADLRILFGFNPLNPIFNYWKMDEVAKMIGSYRENVVTLGYTSMTIALLSLLLFHRQFIKEKLAFLLSFLVGFLILLGPYYQRDGVIYNSVKLPYFYLQKLPFFDIGLVPTRFVLIAYFALAALAGLGMISLIRFFSKRRLHFVITVILMVTVLAILLEYYSGEMLIDYLPRHTYLKRIASEPSDFTVLPFRSSQRDGYLQTEHQKPVVTGFLGRRIHDHYLSQYGNVYPINRFILGRANELNPNDSRESMLEIFSKYKIKYIIIDNLLQDKDQLKKLDSWLTKLGFPRVDSDQHITVYKIN